MPFLLGILTSLAATGVLYVVNVAHGTWTLAQALDRWANERDDVVRRQRNTRTVCRTELSGELMTPQETTVCEERTANFFSPYYVIYTGDAGDEENIMEVDCHMGSFTVRRKTNGEWREPNSYSYGDLRRRLSDERIILSFGRSNDTNQRVA